MNKLLPIIVLLFPAISEAKDDCYQKVITVCPMKHKKKPPVVAPKPGPVPEALPCHERVVEVKVPVEVLVPGPVRYKTVYKTKGCPKEPNVVVGGRLALGLSAKDPYTTGLVGLRLEFPKAYLGLDLFSQLQQGVGAQLLIYPYRGKIVKLHILDPGFLITGDPFQYPNDKDITRRVDLLFGAGIQVRLSCHWSFTADVRFDIPDPAKLADCNCHGGKRINAANAVGNAFAATQLFAGLLVHM